MFKSIGTFFILVSFLISSHMQLVHAFEMHEMSDSEMGMHEMGTSIVSIFCKTDGDTSGKKSPECLKAASQDVLVPTKQRMESGHVQYPAPITVDMASIVWWTECRAIRNSPPTAPPDPYDKCSYASLVGIVKRLD